MTSKFKNILQEIEENRKELAELVQQLSCSLELERMFPNGVWPLYTSIHEDKDTRKLWFKIRDNLNNTKKFKLKDVPLILLQRPHIQNACKTNPRLNRIVNSPDHLRK